MYNMQDCSWFSRYYSEILEIFKYYPGTNIEREFSLNVATYARELQAEIYTKLMDGDIKNCPVCHLLTLSPLSEGAFLMSVSDLDKYGVFYYICSAFMNLIF